MNQENKEVKSKYCSAKGNRYCEEDLYGNCYFCERNMLIPQSLEEKDELTYKTKKLFTVVEIDYSDDTVLFEMEGEDENGTWSSGMYTLEDLIVQLLFKVGKVKETTTYNFNYPKKND